MANLLRTSFGKSGRDTQFKGKTKYRCVFHDAVPVELSHVFRMGYSMRFQALPWDIQALPRIPDPSMRFDVPRHSSVRFDKAYWWGTGSVRVRCALCTCAPCVTPRSSPIAIFTDDNNPDMLEAPNSDTANSIQGQGPMDVDTDTATRIRPGTRMRLEKLCPKCGEWIGLGGRGDLYPFYLHQDGERCRRAAEHKALAPMEGIPVASISSESNEPPLPSCPFIPMPELALDHHPYSPFKPSSTQPTFPHPDVPVTSASPTSWPFAPLSSIVPEHISPTLPDAITLHTLRASQNPPSISTCLPPITALQEQYSHPMFPTAPSIPCRGVRLKWEGGHSSKTYPFQYHDTDNPTWSVTTRRPPDPDIIYLQSFSCALFHDPSMDACFECLRIPSSDKFQSLVLKASKDPAPTVPWSYLSWEQIAKRLKERTDECRQYRKKVGSASSQRIQSNAPTQESPHKSSRLTRQLDDYERLFSLIAVSDYKNTSRVLRVALNNGSSPAAVISKLQLAIEKKYTPQPGIDELALDLGCLVKAIGGPKLLFALNRAFALPSYRTISRHRMVPQLIPSILAPSFEDVSANISTFFNRQERPPSALAGHSILIDGVALEERCRYLRSSNNTIGLCREHAGGLDLQVVNAESILAIEEAVHAEKPRAHYASEATVVAIAPFRQTGYAATPFALSGSCKAETGEGMAKWVTDMINTWNDHPDGAAARGPIWTIATDGESTMRMCRFILCMSHKLTATDPLYSILQNLVGMNLHTGVKNMTMTCDPKHVFKRMSNIYQVVRTLDLTPFRFRHSPTCTGRDTGQQVCHQQEPPSITSRPTPAHQPELSGIPHRSCRQAERTQGGHSYTVHQSTQASRRQSSQPIPNQRASLSRCDWRDILFVHGPIHYSYHVLVRTADIAVEVCPRRFCRLFKTLDRFYDLCSLCRQSGHRQGRVFLHCQAKATRSPG